MLIQFLLRCTRFLAYEIDAEVEVLLLRSIGQHVFHCTNQAFRLQVPATQAEGRRVHYRSGMSLILE